MGPVVAGWSCLVCGKHVDVAEPLVWRCPNASTDDPHHALQIVQHIWDEQRADWEPVDDGLPRSPRGT